VSYFLKNFKAIRAKRLATSIVEGKENVPFYHSFIKITIN